jgi:hypothetical protein
MCEQVMKQQSTRRKKYVISNLRIYQILRSLGGKQLPSTLLGEIKKGRNLGFLVVTQFECCHHQLSILSKPGVQCNGNKWIIFFLLTC